jgi:hypothetical protein
MERPMTAAVGSTATMRIKRPMTAMTKKMKANKPGKKTDPVNRY